jgi:transposase
MSKTHTEIRNENHERELFVITQEMKEAMEKARNKQIQELPENKVTHNIDKGNFRSYDQDQSFFVTVIKDKFLDTEHPAAVIDAIVEQLDLSKLYIGYSLEGNPSYHPKMMLKILFYAYYISTMSCRLIWDAVINRSDFIYLAAGQVPNFRTINNFRLRHLKDLPDLFSQIGMMCKKLGLIGFKHLAVDGEKIQANASFKQSKNIKGIEKEYKKVKKGFKKLLDKDVNEYFTEEVKEKRVQKLSEKLKKLETYKKQLEEIGDKEKRINMTDEDAKNMTHKDGSKKPSYNHQSARDGKCGIVTAIQTTNTIDKPQDLIKIVDKSIENTGKKHEKVTSDCGFCDYDILKKVDEERTEDFYLPDRRYETWKNSKTKSGKYHIEEFKKDESDDYVCPVGLKMKYIQTKKYEDGHTVIVYEGTGCENCDRKEKCTRGKKRKINVDSRIIYRDKMREKLKSEKGRETYMKRQGLIEPVHGDDQKNRGWKQHHLRGAFKTAMEFILIRITTNLGIMIKHKRNEILGWAET